jgi:hypothetical protein
MYAVFSGDFTERAVRSAESSSMVYQPSHPLPSEALLISNT